MIILSDIRTVSEGDLIDGSEVRAKCDVKTYGGYWFCTAHGPQQHNLAAAGHTGETCELAWFCFGHNAFEVP